MYFPSPRFVKLIKCFFVYASSYPAASIDSYRRTTARSECIYTAEHHKCTVCDHIRRHTNLNMEIIYAAVAAAVCATSTLQTLCRGKK